MLILFLWLIHTWHSLMGLYAKYGRFTFDLSLLFSCLVTCASTFGFMLLGTKRLTIFEIPKVNFLKNDTILFFHLFFNRHVSPWTWGLFKCIVTTAKGIKQRLQLLSNRDYLNTCRDYTRMVVWGENEGVFSKILHDKMGKLMRTKSNITIYVIMGNNTKRQ